MNQHATHAKRGGYLAGMLATGAAEAHERELFRVVAGTQRHMPHSIGHGTHGYGQKVLGELCGVVHVVIARLASGDFAGRVGRHFVRQFREGVAHSCDIEPFIGRGAEHLRETFGQQPAQQHVGIGDGEWPATAITARAGVCTCRSGARRQTTIGVPQHAATAGSHGVNVEHGHLQGQARQHIHRTSRQVAINERHIGTGAAHVETDESLVTGSTADPLQADQAAGRARQQSVHAAKPRCIREAAMALHERHFGGGECSHAFAKALDVTLEDGREIGVCQRGVSAWHPTRQRRYLMRGEHLRETRRSRCGSRQQFMAGVRPAMQEADGDRFAAFLACSDQRGLQGMARRGV